MDVVSIQQVILTAVASFLTGGITYYFARRKNTAEARGKEIDNVEKSLVVYREILKDLREEINRQNDTILKQEIEIQKMKLQISELRKYKKPC